MARGGVHNRGKVTELGLELLADVAEVGVVAGDRHALARRRVTYRIVYRIVGVPDRDLPEVSDPREPTHAR